MTDLPRAFRRASGFVVHLQIPGYAPNSSRTRTAVDRQSLCAASAWDHRDGPVIDVEQPLPEGLRWCAKCVGLYAEYVNRLTAVAADLLAPNDGEEAP